MSREPERKRRAAAGRRPAQDGATKKRMRRRLPEATPDATPVVQACAEAAPRALPDEPASGANGDDAVGRLFEAVEATSRLTLAWYGAVARGALAWQRAALRSLAGDGRDDS